MLRSYVKLSWSVSSHATSLQELHGAIEEEDPLKLGTIYICRFIYLWISRLTTQFTTRDRTQSWLWDVGVALMVLRIKERIRKFHVIHIRVIRKWVLLSIMLWCSAKWILFEVSYTVFTFLYEYYILTWNRVGVGWSHIASLQELHGAYEGRPT